MKIQRSISQLFGYYKRFIFYNMKFVHINAQADLINHLFMICISSSFIFCLAILYLTLTILALLSGLVLVVKLKSTLVLGFCEVILSCFENVQLEDLSDKTFN